MVKALRILKIVPGRVERLCWQSLKPECVVTHWLNSHVLCAGDDCCLCGRLPSRPSFFSVCLYLGAGLPRPVVLEMSSQSLARLRFFDTEGSLPGLVFTAKRVGAKAPTYLEPAGERQDVRPELSAPEVLVDTLAVVYKLPARHATEEIPAWQDRCQPLIEHRSRVAALTLG